VRCSDGVVVGRVGVRLGGRGTLLSGPAQQHSLGRAGARLPGTLDPVPPVDPVPQPRHNRPERRRGPRVTVLANYKVLTTRKPPPVYSKSRRPNKERRYSSCLHVTSEVTSVIVLGSRSCKNCLAYITGFITPNGKGHLREGGQ